MQKALGGIDRVSEWSGKLASFLLLPLIAIICYDVFVRYVLNMPTDWADDLSCYIFGTIWLIGGAYALHHKAHVRMEVFYDRLPSRWRNLVDVLTAPFLFIFAGILLWQGLDLTIASWAKLEHASTTWGPPVYFIKAMIPLGSFLILLQGLAKFARDIAVLAKGGAKA